MFWSAFFAFLCVLVLIVGIFCILMGLAGSPGGLLILGLAGIITQRIIRKRLAH